MRFSRYMEEAAEYLGNLFKNRTRRNNRSELLIFLTPKMVTERAALSALLLHSLATGDHL